MKNESFYTPHIWVITPKNGGYGFPWYSLTSNKDIRETRSESSENHLFGLRPRRRHDGIHPNYFQIVCDLAFHSKIIIAIGSMYGIFYHHFTISCKCD